MSIIKTLSYIYNHPFHSEKKTRGLLIFFKWQLNCLINPYPVVYNYTENSKLIIRKGLTGATGNIYCGLHEFDDMGFLLHFLRSSDLFIDVGANIGAYTILASAEINSRVIAIEPLPVTFNNLLENISINNVTKNVKALNIGLGSCKGKLSFTKSHDTLNHVATENEKDIIELEVQTLDSLCLKEIPLLIKIDVEGYESKVLEGAEKILKNDKLKAIIIELNGSGNRYGFDENKIHLDLIDKGFKPYSYNPKTRGFLKLETYGSHNTIYIRDLNYAKKRVRESRPIKIGYYKQNI